MLKRTLLLILFLILSISLFSENDSLIFLENQFPCEGFYITGRDIPNDGGSGIEINWSFPDSLDNCFLTVLRRDEFGNNSVVATDLLVSSKQVRDVSSDEEPSRVKDGIKYYYTGILSKKIIDENFLNILKEKSYLKNGTYIFNNDTFYVTSETDAVISKASWFNLSRIPVLISLIIIAFVFLYYLNLAKSGKELYIRKINGLDAVEEAVGRSTEMGKPIMYILGIGYVTDIPTIAGLTILSRVSKKVAEYETKILVPSYDPVVMTTAQEVVKEAFTEAGRPDLYNKNDIMYITQDQFGYAAGVDGMMMREKPGAVFLQGLFFAESLILAETGHSIGAIQISGTTETAQLPFFVAACDYTLIGEEMMAASVYLQKEPMMLSSIAAEDLLKVFIMLLIIAGFVISIFAFGFNIGLFKNLFDHLVNALQV
ncbi:MAG: hypothetical protein QME48_04365 [bacterium]|nr:hypothetical protein [bacterium]